MMRGFFAVAAMCLSVSACEGGGSDQSVAPDVTSPILQRSWSVGGSADTAFSFASLSVHGVAVDAQNRILLTDRDNYRVIVLSAEGALVDSWGRQGDGPGELRFPLTLAVAPDSTTHVFDSGRSRVIVFGPDGTLREELLVERERPFRTRYLNDGTRVGSLQTYADSSRLFRDSSGVRLHLAALVRPESRSTPPVCRLTDYPVDPIFAPELAWDADGSRVVASVGEFAVSVFESGREARVLRRDTTRRRTSRELAARMIGDGPTFQIQGQKPCRVPAEMVLEVADIAPEIPAYSALTLDAAGMIWATRVTLPDEPAIADLFDVDSGYLETVPLGSARPVGFLHDGRMLSIERDRDDVPMLVVYTVLR